MNTSSPPTVELLLKEKPRVYILARNSLKGKPRDVALWVNEHLITTYGGASPQGEAKEGALFLAFPLRGRWLASASPDEVGNRPAVHGAKLSFAFMGQHCRGLSPPHP